MVGKPNILLVNPACLDERITSEDARIVPIGLFYIAAQLLGKGFSTQILNLADTKTDPLETFKQTIKDSRPDIIGFSVTNPNRWNAIACAKAAKNSLPSTTIVFGGPAPTFMAEHLFEACPQIDYIVSGEGEISFLELSAFLQQNSNGEYPEEIPGLVFKKKILLVKTDPREPIHDLDTLVHPSRYFAYQHLAMSRGCPGKCTFCGSPKFWNDSKVRFHSPQWFADEIESLYQKGIAHFYISDDTFTKDKKQVLEVCRLLTEKKLDITWNAISRVDYIDADILQAMRKAGCIQISYGVESGSEQIRKILGKPIDEKKIIQAFSLTRSYGILPRAYFIYGSPDETIQTINESIELLKQIQPLSAIFYMLVIFPGTYLYRSAIRKGRLTDDIWHKKIEDLPWFEVDDQLDFPKVKSFGDALRQKFYSNLNSFTQTIDLIDKKELYPFHADFLSRLALTFSHGEYANNPHIKNQAATAKLLYKKALSYAPDARAFLGLAMIHQKSGQFKEAIELLEKGLKLWPGNPDLNICMGVSLMNTQNFEPALVYFERFKDSPGIKNYIRICNQQIAGK